ncbi:GNAT family N-acetyltransferase [Sporosarcina aquimarina]|uniref:GNAT family N-acetyltransferase n=1 Tax=Sporosarcina aquimarina TaxID=114975 RepID=UPI00203DD09C|nr:GNAT family N-acetyltransferase [Sporosarcina aquimarina]MCM3756318.1 GNAT family N-acetyltransferase [Sporosarcina aquimarina]
MSYKNKKDDISFYNLEWDTKYFDVTCAKVIIYRPLELKEWEQLLVRFKDYQFISIENRDSEPVNSQFIGRDTSAFLADVNIQFVKKVEGNYVIPGNITVHQGFKKNDQIVDMADFQFSKFTEDPQLAKRGGDKVYLQWLMNSFEKSNKYYALSWEQQGRLNGFLLHSYSENACVVELIAAAKSSTKRGIGSSLFRSVEYHAFQRGIKEIKVGTQVRNMAAINFYHKVGCKQVGCHQVYHLWNI